MPDRHVFEATRDDEGSHRLSAVYLDPHGLLVIEIHDRGPVVTRAFGMSEYESIETFSAEQTAQLRDSLGEDLISSIAERFTHPAALTQHCAVVGVGRGKLWNRIGD